MTSLRRHLSPTTIAQQHTVNWVTTADRCIHTADTTQLDFAAGKFGQTRRDCCQLVTSAEEGGDVFTSVCLSVCLSVRRVTKKM